MKVQESDSLSVLALLVLPAILSIFPLAMLPAALAYTVATDIISVLPLAIQGVELLVYGSRKHYGHVTDISGINHTQKLSYIITLVAECEMKPSFRRRGVAYVTGAVLLMIFGISLEVFSNRAISRRNQIRTWSGFVLLGENGHDKTLRMSQRPCSYADTLTSIGVHPSCS